jgi:hydroxymethylglutaryl-CoA reductase
MSVNSRLPGFYKLSPRDRLASVTRASGLSEADLASLVPADPEMLAIADRMVENVVGALSIPVGIAANFTIGGRDYLVPMATEEPSVVAAASNMAAVARLHGGFHVSTDLPIMVSQVQVVGVSDPRGARLRLYEAEAELLALANEQDPLLVKLGGGATRKDLQSVVSGQGGEVGVDLVGRGRD